MHIAKNTESKCCACILYVACVCVRHVACGVAIGACRATPMSSASACTLHPLPRLVADIDVASSRRCIYPCRQLPLPSSLSLCLSLPSQHACLRHLFRVLKGCIKAFIIRFYSIFQFSIHLRYENVAQSRLSLSPSLSSHLLASLSAPPAFTYCTLLLLLLICLLAPACPLLNSRR